MKVEPNTVEICSEDYGIEIEVHKNYLISSKYEINYF